ncbi:ACP S-malonyltransferase [Thermodesulfobacteriota bacterium]
MKNKSIAVLFPGQGSQFIGMGKEFLESDQEAGLLMDLADSISSASLRKFCLEGPLEELTKAVYLQPALTAVNLICWQAVKKAGIRPEYFVGHSLGEYSALCASGVLEIEDTLKLVTERGRLSEREGQINPGGMQAVLGLTLEEVEEVLATFPESSRVTIANHNSEKQIVVSGYHETLAALGGMVSEKGGKAITLNVSVANHSPLVAGAIPDFEKIMADISFQTPETPVLFNVTAAEEKEPAAIRTIMGRQIASRVRWFEIINSLVYRGVTHFIEVGPKKVLSGLMKKIAPKSSGCKRYQVDSPESLARCLEGLNEN